MNHRTKMRLRTVTCAIAAATVATVLGPASGAPTAAGPAPTGRQPIACEPSGSAHAEGHGHDHGTCAGTVNFTDAGPWRPEPDPDTTWLNTHCKASASETTASHVVTPLFVYNGETGSSISDWQKRMREEIYAADRAIAESDPTWPQHLRVACTTDANGQWLNIWTPSHPVYNTNDYSTDCGDAPASVRPYYNRGDRRYIYYADQTLDPNQVHSCSMGGMDTTDTQPGTTNKANRDWGFAMVDPDHWIVSGSSNVSTSFTLQELFHSFGIVGQGAPGADGTAHTRDYPDTMNAGYYAPHPDVVYPGQICSTWTAAMNMTHKDSFLDCGRDTYWTIKARPGDWLCDHFNLATDSLYLQPRPDENC